MNTPKEEYAAPNDTEWEEIEWREIEQYVEKMQRRIYHAEYHKKYRKVREMQRLLMRSEAGMLISVKKVSESVKRGLSTKEKLGIYNELGERKLELHRPKRGYRRYFEAEREELREIDIAVMRDRIYQNVVKMALEAQWKAKFESGFYGVGGKGSYREAVEQILEIVKEDKRKWIFVSEFENNVRELNHGFIMKLVKGFPGCGLIEKWLKAGYVDNRVFEVGTKKEDIIGTLLMDIALNGMENAINARYCEEKKDERVILGKGIWYKVVNYGRDFVVMCQREEEAEKVKELIKPYLQERGLGISQGRTVHIDNGFDFIGFNVRSMNKGTEKVSIKPSERRVSDFKKSIALSTKKLYGSNVQTLIRRLNPIIEERANYWIKVSGKKRFSEMDKYIWEQVFKFLTRMHPKKSWKWITQRYFRESRTGRSKWILTDPETGIQLKKMTLTRAESKD